MPPGSDTTGKPSHRACSSWHDLASSRLNKCLPGRFRHKGFVHLSENLVNAAGLKPLNRDAQDLSDGRSAKSASASGLASASLFLTGRPCTTSRTASSTILPDLVRGMSATAMILAGTWRGD